MNTDEIVTVREGTTNTIQFTLYANDTEVDLTSVDHIELSLKDSKNKVLHFSSDDTPTAQIAILVAASGSVGYTPASTDLIASRSPYRGYWWIVDTGGTSKFAIPENDEFLIYVTENF